MDKIRYLQVFIERFVPPYIQQNYPLYKTFIEEFLGYISKKEGLYDSMINFIRYRDIDYISSLLTSSDSDQRELGEKLISEVYAEFLGTKEARYISSLLDDILFLKKQKGIMERKGLKSSFLFLFLIILGGYFRIQNVEAGNKTHNGTYLYNGIITYSSIANAIEPFIYLITSEFYPDQYTKILATIAPAGMLPYYVFTKEGYETFTGTGENIESVFAKPNIYAIIYNGSTNIGMIRVASISYTEQVSASGGTYDLELPDATLWRKYTTYQTGIDHILYGVYFSKTFFGSIELENQLFDRLVFISNPASNSAYFYLPEDEDLTGAENLFEHTFTGGPYPIIINSTILNIILQVS